MKVLNKGENVTVIENIIYECGPGQLEFCTGSSEKGIGCALRRVCTQKH